MHSPKTQKAHNMRPTETQYYLNIAKTKPSKSAGSTHRHVLPAWLPRARRVAGQDKPYGH
jgi:hypothetical protein